jgi:cell division septation protein DedD
MCKFYQLLLKYNSVCHSNHIVSLFDSIQRLGNKTAHIDEHLTDRTTSEALVVESSLGNICNWFFNEYLKVELSLDNLYDKSRESDNSKLINYEHLIRSALSDKKLDIDEYEEILKAIDDLKINGSHSNASNFINSLKNVNSNINFIIMNDSLSETSPLFPTKKNIIKQLNNFCSSSEIVGYFYYSGKCNNDSIVTNEQTTQDILSNNDIIRCLKNISSNKKIYAFIDSYSSILEVDLFSIHHINLKKNINFSSETISDLIVEMNHNKVVSSYYPKNQNNIKGLVVFMSGINLTSTLSRLINNGIGKLNLNNFYLVLFVLLGTKLINPMIYCSQLVSFKKMLMVDFYNGKNIENNNLKLFNNMENNEYEIDSDYVSSEELIIPSLAEEQTITSTITTSTPNVPSTVTTSTPNVPPNVPPTVTTTTPTVSQIHPLKQHRSNKLSYFLRYKKNRKR